MAERKIAIIGAGRIGEALLSGLLSSGWRSREEIVVTTRSESRAALLHERHGVEATTSNPDAVRGAGLVVVAVKPQDIDTRLGEIGPLLPPARTVRSVAAAIRTRHIEERIAAGVPVVRAMPNSPSTVHEGMAGICAGAQAGGEQLAPREGALLHPGRVVRRPGAAKGAVASVSGGGPRDFAPRA